MGAASRLLIDAGLSPAARLIFTLTATSGGVTLFMAFLVFGKRRRDGEPTAPDEVLAVAAAQLTSPVPSASLVRDGPFRPVIANPDGLSPEELAMPRWRRPSLLEARKADPLRSAATTQALSFDHGAVGPIDGHERRLLRYRLVRLLDQPDELRGNEIGFLDEGDEVQLLERAGSYWLVLAPDGSQGWIHKMTLGDVVEAAPQSDDMARRPFGSGAGTTAAFATAGAGIRGFGPAGFDATRRPSGVTGEELDGVDDDVVTAFLSARGNA
jgi:hypothetical protein